MFIRGAWPLRPHSGCASVICNDRLHFHCRFGRLRHSEVIGRVEFRLTYQVLLHIVCLKNECDDLNNFSEVGKSLSAKIMPPPVTYRHFPKNINSNNSLFLAPTDAYEIQRLIKNLKRKSNSSPNDIPSKFFKIASCIVSEWLSNFFNRCMTIDEFPYSWKIAHITPIPEVHSPSSSFEYRLCFLCSPSIVKVI